MKLQVVTLNDGTVKREIVIESLDDCGGKPFEQALTWLVDVEMKLYEKDTAPLRLVKSEAK